MSVSAKPWMMFYPQDWRADESLRLCTLAARGLWVEMLALMHRSERYGYLLVKGKPPTDRQLAALVGGTVDDVSAGLAELAEFDVFSRDRSGTIYSRRMIRDEKRSKTNAKNGAKGGNPKLRKQKGNSGSHNPPENPPLEDALKPQSPESRVHKKKDCVEKRDHPLPDDWQPEPFGDGTKSRAIVDSWPADHLAVQVEKFRAYHTGHGSKWKDWQKAWATWVLNAGTYVPRLMPQSRQIQNSDEAYVARSIEEIRKRTAWEEEQKQIAAGGAP